MWQEQSGVKRNSVTATARHIILITVTQLNDCHAIGHADFINKYVCEYSIYWRLFFQTLFITAEHENKLLVLTRDVHHVQSSDGLGPNRTCNKMEMNCWDEE